MLQSIQLFPDEKIKAEEADSEKARIIENCLNASLYIWEICQHDSFPHRGLKGFASVTLPVTFWMKNIFFSFHGNLLEIFENNASSRPKSDMSGNVFHSPPPHFPFASWERGEKKLTLIKPLLWSKLCVWTLYTLSHSIPRTTLSGSYYCFCHFTQNIKLTKSRNCVQTDLEVIESLGNFLKWACK